MSVDVKFVTLVGVKKEYNWVEIYESKNDPDYIYDLEHNDINAVHVVFKDYLPDGYISLRDSMCGEYSCIGKALINVNEYMDEIGSISLTQDILQKHIDEVYEELKNQKLNINKEDIELHIFTHFS